MTFIIWITHQKIKGNNGAQPFGLGTSGLVQNLFTLAIMEPGQKLMKK
jgi:hypothetical protein